jgi:hypothetical protein
VSRNRFGRRSRPYQDFRHHELEMAPLPLLQLERPPESWGDRAAILGRWQADLAENRIWPALNVSENLNLSARLQAIASAASGSMRLGLAFNRGLR